MRPGNAALTTSAKVIVAGNSAILPTAGASGTIQFVAKDVSTCPLLPALSCTWVVPANGTLTLQYTVNVPNTVGSYTNSIKGKIGAEQIDTTRREQGEGELGKLLHAGDTWQIA